MSEIICKICNKKFKNERTLYNHMRRNACQDKKYSCKVCSSAYSHKRSVLSHIKKKHVITDLKEINDNIIELHQRSEKTNVSVKFSEDSFNCLFCNTNFSNKSNLKRHVAKYCEKAKEVISKNDKSNKTTKNTKNVKNINNGTINNNNTVNNNNITNNINININKFEKEDISKISYEDFMEAIKDPEDIPVKYLELKHIKTPSNMNICIKNKEMVYVFKGDHWQELRMADVCHLMKNGAIYDIDQFIRANHVKNSDAINRRLDEVEGERKYDKIMDLLIDNSGPLINNFNHNKAPTVSFATLMENKKKNKV